MTVWQEVKEFHLKKNVLVLGSIKRKGARDFGIESCNRISLTTYLFEIVYLVYILNVDDF